MRLCQLCNRIVSNTTACNRVGCPSAADVLSVVMEEVRVEPGATGRADHVAQATLDLVTEKSRAVSRGVLMVGLGVIGALLLGGAFYATLRLLVPSQDKAGDNPKVALASPSPASAPPTAVASEPAAPVASAVPENDEPPPEDFTPPAAAAHEQAVADNAASTDAIAAAWKAIDPSRRADLLPLQRSWIKAKQANCRMVATSASQDATEQETARLNCDTEKNNSRIDWLNQFVAG
ncbi:MAG: DUF1311 domain-containing protein [Sphingomonadales bacterium]|nr:DUF1311 domain-containing protein [Sphingomonadales bacterium]